jgi:predicted amidophosphoribosyltransferase
MKKWKPCLRCDKEIFTTPERRICSKCKSGLDHECAQLGGKAKNGNYAAYHEANGGLDYQPKFSRPKNTRHYE